MEQIRDLAIVLRWVPYEERHRVVTALTENHGKISALARNSIQSRRFGGALEPFAAAEWHFVERPGADLYRVEEAHIRRSFDGLREDFTRLALASALNEVMIRLAPEREPCPDLFKLHSNALALLDESLLPEGSEVALLNAYLAKMLQWSGNQPQLQWCRNCHLALESLQPHVAISCLVADASWVCETCRVEETRHVREREGQRFHHSMLRVTPAALNDFYLSLTTPIKKIPQVLTASQYEHKGLFAFLDALMVYHSPGFDRSALKSLRFLGLESSVPHPEANSPRSRFERA